MKGWSFMTNNSINESVNREYVMGIIKEKLHELDLMTSIDLISSMVTGDVMDITVSFQMQLLLAALKGPAVAEAITDTAERVIELLTNAAGDLISDCSTTNAVAYAQAYAAAKETLRYSSEYLRRYPFEKEVTTA